MELETLFSEQKWNILKCLSEGKYSPLQLAERLDTTMANISQQLRLLEAANLVKKEKIKNRDKGKPRTLFSLRENYAYLIPAMENFADKRLLKVTDHQKIILRIWFLEDSGLNFSIEKSYWKMQNYLDYIDSIVFSQPLKELIVISRKHGEIMKALSKIKAPGARVISPENARKLIEDKKEPFRDISQVSIVHDRGKLFSKSTKEVVQ